MKDRRDIEIFRLVVSMLANALLLSWRKRMEQFKQRLKGNHEC